MSCVAVTLQFGMSIFRKCLEWFSTGCSEEVCSCFADVVCWRYKKWKFFLSAFSYVWNSEYGPKNAVALWRFEFSCSSTRSIQSTFSLICFCLYTSLCMAFFSVFIAIPFHCVTFSILCAVYHWMQRIFVFLPVFKQDNGRASAQENRAFVCLFQYTCYILCDSHHMHRLRFSSSFFISW